MKAVEVQSRERPVENIDFFGGLLTYFGVFRYADGISVMNQPASCWDRQMVSVPLFVWGFFLLCFPCESAGGSDFFGSHISHRMTQPSLISSTIVVFLRWFLFGDDQTKNDGEKGEKILLFLLAFTAHSLTSLDLYVVKTEQYELVVAAAHHVREHRH